MPKYLDDNGLLYFWQKIKAKFLTNVEYDSTNKKLTKTVNGTTSDIVSVSTIKTALNLSKSDVGLGNVDNTADADKQVASADTLTTARGLEGVSFNGSAGTSYYATCSTAAGTAAKVATIADQTFSLATGSRVFVRFTHANSAASSTLNVNGTGAKAIYYNGAAIAKSVTDANGTYEFVYNGTQWELVGDLDTNTTYTAASATPKMDGTAAVGSSTKYAREDHVHPSDTSKVDKVEGKELSSNDFTDALESKLEGIAAGAEVNQNAFSNVTVGSTTIAADAKTDTLTIVAGSNVTITPDATNGELTIAATDTTYTPASATPKMDGTAAVGTSAKYAREDHVHPSDTSRVPTTRTVNGHALSANISLTASDVSAVATSAVGSANGVCPLNANAVIDSTYLPSYVDDIIEAYPRSGQTALSSTWLATGSASGTVITPEAGKIYILMADSGDYAANSQFRWSGSSYVKMADGGVSAITNAEIDTIVAA